MSAPDVLLSCSADMMEFDGVHVAAAGQTVHTVTTAAAPAGATAVQTAAGTYEYHLPHTKTIDLIGEEFAPRSSVVSTSASSSKSSPNVVVVSAVPMSAGSLPPGVSAITSSTALPAGLQFQPGLPVSVISGSLANVVVSSAAGQSPAVTTVANSGAATLPLQLDQSQLTATAASAASPGQLQLPSGTQLSTVTVDLSNNLTTAATAATDESGGVLLCNLDELSRYIPENFDFNLADASTLEATAPASAASALVPQSAAAATKLPPGAPIQLSLANGTILQAAAPVTTLPQAPVQTVAAASGVVSTPAGPITIQLPTQPQPVQSVKTVTYVPGKQQQQPPQATPAQSLKLTTTGFAVTPSGERVAIKGLENTQLQPGSTVQVQVKHHPGGGIQLQGLNIDPSKLTVLQELPDVSKVIIQEPRHQTDSITNILEEMKTEEANNAGLAAAGVEYATAIPVAVTNLKDPGKGLKRMGPPSTIVLPAKRGLGVTATPAAAAATAAAAAAAAPNPGGGARNIIFAGNTLPQGAIPVQISGLSAALPLSAVKGATSIPLPINLSTLSPSTTVQPQQPQVVAAKKSKVEVISTRPPPQVMAAAAAAANVVRVTNNNSSVVTSPLKTSGSQLSKTGGQLKTGGSPGVGGNNKTCNWQFENGEICGKTFSKSYNLVVHMRMHEDIRPFQCSLCDQTFRQKAHLQRHETTHGIGAKVTRPSATSSGGGGSSSKKRRKRSSRGGGGGPQQQLGAPTPPQITPQLQERLARVSEQFGTKMNVGRVSDEEEDMADDSLAAESIGKNYSQKKYSAEATTVEVEEALKAVQEGSDHQVTEIIELKDGEAFLAAATGSLTDDKSVRNVAVKLKKVDEHGNVIAVTSAASAGTTSTIDAISVATAAADIRDGDFIEEDLTGPQAPNATVSAAEVTDDDIVVSSSESPVAAVVTLASAAPTIDSVSTEAGGNKTIVIANLGEEHKDILNAILEGGAASNGDEAPSEGGVKVETEAAAVVESVVAATESLVSSTPAEAHANGLQSEEAAASQPPPVTVDEFAANGEPQDNEEKRASSN